MSSSPIGPGIVNSTAIAVPGEDYAIEHVVAAHEQRQIKILRSAAYSLTLLLPECNHLTPDAVIDGERVELKVAIGAEDCVGLIRRGIAQLDAHALKHGLEGGAVVITLEPRVEIDAIVEQLNAAALAHSSNDNPSLSRGNREVYVVAGPDLWLLVRGFDGLYRVVETPREMSGWRGNIINMRDLHPMALGRRAPAILGVHR